MIMGLEGCMNIKGVMSAAVAAVVWTGGREDRGMAVSGGLVKPYIRYILI
jgi:hypothetical protein